PGPYAKRPQPLLGQLLDGPSAALARLVSHTLEFDNRLVASRRGKLAAHVEPDPQRDQSERRGFSRRKSLLQGGESARRGVFGEHGALMLVRLFGRLETP